MTEKELICGKCRTKQMMKTIKTGNKKEDWSWWCPNCKDRINQGSVFEAKEEQDAHE